MVTKAGLTVQCTCVKHTYLYNMPSRSIVTQTIDIREGWCLIYVTYVCLRIVVSNTYYVDFCFVFLRLVYPMLTVSLDCPFLIVPSIFSSLFIYICLHYFFLYMYFSDSKIIVQIIDYNSYLHIIHSRKVWKYQGR